MYEYISRMKQRFKNLSLKRKLLVLYSVLFLLPLLLISIIINIEVSQNMLEKMQYSSRQSYEQAQSYLEFKILQMIQRTDVVVTNSSLKEQIDEKNALVMDRHLQAMQKDKIRSYIQSVESSTQSISIRIYVSDAFQFLDDTEYILRLSEADNSIWYQKKGSQKIYFAPGLYLEESKQEDYVALVRDIPADNNYRIRNAVLRMDIKIEELVEILRNATPTENAVSYLINKENIILAVSSPQKLDGIGLGQELPELFQYSPYGEESELTESSIQNNTVYYLRNKIRNTDWEMITIIPKTDMVSGVSRLQYIVAGLMILFGFLTITGGAAIISWIVRRISNLIDSINQVKQGNLDAHLENENKDEIGTLYDSYNTMIQNTNLLMEEKYKMGISLKSAELKALQSQISPHFLYNTLDMVNWLAFAGRTQDIHSAVVSLSKYYRIVLNKGEDTLTLEEELQHVGYYMKIQDIRFPGDVVYQENVEEKVMGSIVPKIILQPLVENAIHHGIWKKKEKKGSIRIWGYEEGKTVHIKIIDDGAGMDADTLSRILDGSLSTTGSSYGVKNVHARLSLMFGEEYGLSYESKEGQGTCVTIRFPAGK